MAGSAQAFSSLPMVLPAARKLFARHSWEWYVREMREVSLAERRMAHLMHSSGQKGSPRCDCALVEL